MSTTFKTTPQLPQRVFPVPYQIDFSVESKGRHLDSTKRKLVWKFGFADPPSVFPHLFDDNGNSMGDMGSDGNIVPYPDNPKTGVECRGREHEIILMWSLLTGKAHIYVDSRETFRQEPLKDEIFNPFSAQFHRGFDLPNAKFNGRHRIDIRCYARTPLGAKNMKVDNRGGTFRQYDLTVDGLSYFAFPAMFELGTPRMWTKVSRWGMMRLELSAHEQQDAYGGVNASDVHRRHSASGDFERRGRVQDEYYFEKAKRSDDSQKYSGFMSKSEYKAMNPRSESEEERMMTIAMEASLQDWDEDVGYGKKGRRGGASGLSRSYSEGDRQKNGRAPRKNAHKMASIGEDNLIDFGVDEASNAVSQITFSRNQTMSDVSVLGDDDATTASFMLNTAWGSNGARPTPPLAAAPSPGLLYPGQQPQYQTQHPQYHDPTFQQQPSNIGRASLAPPRVGLPSDASFAIPPPPTWDDYNNAFGAVAMNAGVSVAGGSSMMAGSPLSPVTSPTSQQPPQRYGMQQPSQWQSQSLGVPGGGGAPGAPSARVPKGSHFDPLRADPFSS